MNLRKCDRYTIGLDIGTGSVGWAVIDEEGNLLKFKGKNTWGARLFDNADTAASTRIFRTLRRRYDRRRQRILELRKIMESDINQVDKDFFIRLDQSSLWSEDKSLSCPYVLVHEPSSTNKDYFGNFETIYHLRQHLVKATGKEDIRLVYLALHHIIKYRGHFLQSGRISAKDANSKEAIEGFIEAFESFCDTEGIDSASGNIDEPALYDAIVAPGLKRADRVDAFMEAIVLPADQKKLGKAIAHAVFGYKAQFADIFPIESNSDTKFALGEDKKVEKFIDEIVPEDSFALFTCLQSLHNAYMLSGLLKDADGGTISSAFVTKWNRHKEELEDLKRLVKTYAPNKYNMVFRGARYADGTYKRKDAQGYTAYILGKSSPDDFYSFLQTNVFSENEFTDADKEVWARIQESIKEGAYLKKLRTSDNGAIPHQLHQEELNQIIEHQAQYYPSLRESAGKIESLLTFRIPYYVGPLGKNRNPQRTKPFGWMVRHEGMEDAEIKPWNFFDVVNRDETAERFITNLIGECTYYLGKKVIPKNSLLYSEFCVRQELNVCRVAYDGENFVRFEPETVERIIEGLFKKRKKITVSALQDFLRSELGYINRTVTGTQKENEFASSLSSYNDFSRILNRSLDNLADKEMVEEIITWVTVFEDKDILKRRLGTVYGPDSENNKLDERQIKEICKLRYSGWSNLSREFLEELRVDYEGGRVSIMGILRDSRKTTPMNLMEILSDERFGFQDLLSERNKEYLANAQGRYLDDIPGSPAIKRGINQSMKIIEEIVAIAGKPPTRICVEMAREEVGKGKGTRTKTRLQLIEEKYKAAHGIVELHAEIKECSSSLKETKNNLDNEQIYLYHIQLGKCLYCGKPLDINNLQLCQVDHIIPQMMIKDDSYDNKALVHAGCNQSKRDVYPVPEQVRQSMFSRWKALRDAGLLSVKKFNSLIADRLDERQIKRFINRQLVETRQISKHVVQALQAAYPDTRIESVKAELTHDLRSQYGFYKSRLVNDYHHAHDAYLACQISRFVAERYPKIHKDFDYSQFAKYTASARNNRYSSKGFIVGSFGYTGFDKETGEIMKDKWDAEAELTRIRTCLNYKDCFVSKKVEKLKGQFWDETIYPRREKSESQIPLKKGLDPNKYGYYSSMKSAYYSLIAYVEEVRGKKKEKTALVGIPVNISYGIGSEIDLHKYLISKYEDAKILIPQIMKYQKIEWAGGEYYLTSHSEIINAKQLWVPARYSKFLDDCKNISSDNETELSAVAIDFCNYLICRIEDSYPRYANIVAMLKEEKTTQHFLKATLGEKVDMLSELLAMLHCDSSRGLAKWGLASTCGRMSNVNIGSNSGSMTWISTSVTGMYENRKEL